MPVITTEELIGTQERTVTTEELLGTPEPQPQTDPNTQSQPIRLTPQQEEAGTIGPYNPGFIQKVKDYFTKSIPTLDEWKTVINRPEGYTPSAYEGGAGKEIQDRAFYAAMKIIPFARLTQKAMLIGQPDEVKKAFQKKIDTMPEKFTDLGSLYTQPAAETAKLALDWTLLYPTYFKAAGITNDTIAAIPMVQKAAQVIENMGGIKTVAENYPRIYQAAKNALGAGVKGAEVFGGEQTFEGVGQGTPYTEQVKNILISGLTGAAYTGAFSVASSTDKALYIRKLRSTLTDGLRSQMKSAIDEFGSASNNVDSVTGQVTGKNGEFVRRYGTAFNTNLDNLQRNGLKQIDNIVAETEAQLTGLTKGDMYGNIGGKVTPPQEAANQFLQGYVPGQGESYAASPKAEVLKTGAGQIPKSGIEIPTTKIGQVTENLGDTIKQLKDVVKFSISPKFGTRIQSPVTPSNITEPTTIIPNQTDLTNPPQRTVTTEELLKTTARAQDASKVTEIAPKKITLFRAMTKPEYEEWKRTGVIKSQRDESITGSDIRATGNYDTANYYMSVRGEGARVVKFEVNPSDIELVSGTRTSGNYRFVNDVKTHEPGTSINEKGIVSKIEPTNPPETTGTQGLGANQATGGAVAESPEATIDRLDAQIATLHSTNEPIPQSLLAEREIARKALIEQGPSFGGVATKKVGFTPAEGQGGIKTETVPASSLSFREREQNRIKETKEFLGNLDEYDAIDFPPITVIRKNDGSMLILDGHNRTKILADNGKDVRVVTIPEEVYNKIKANSDYDELDISAGMLENAGEWDALSNLNSQFPGAGIHETSTRVSNIIDSLIQSPTPPSPSVGEKQTDLAKPAEAGKIVELDSILESTRTKENTDLYRQLSNKESQLKMEKGKLKGMETSERFVPQSQKVKKIQTELDDIKQKISVSDKGIATVRHNLRPDLFDKNGKLKPAGGKVETPVDTGQGNLLDHRQGGFVDLSGPIETAEEVVNISRKLARRMGLTGKIKNIPKMPVKTAEMVNQAVQYGTAPISFRLEKINPMLSQGIRRHAFDVIMNTHRALQKLSGLFKSQRIFGGMELADEDAFFESIFRRDFEAAGKIAEKNGFGKDFEAARQYLDESYQRGLDNGLSTRYKADYWPQRIKNQKGLIEYLYQDRDNRSIIEDAKRNFTEKHNRIPIDREMDDILNVLIRGFKTNGVILNKPGFSKTRRIEYVDKDMRKFYYDPIQALRLYIHDLETTVANNQFFGRVNEEYRDLKRKESTYRNKIAKYETLEKARRLTSEEAEIGDNAVSVLESVMKEIREKGYDAPLEKKSAGRILNELVKKGIIKPGQDTQTQDLLRSYFNPERMNTMVRAFVSMNYFAKLGNSLVLHNITQLPESGLSYLESWRSATQEIFKAFTGKSELTAKDLPFVQHIGEDFQEISLDELVTKVLGVSMYTDKPGKVALVNTTVREGRRLAQMKNPPAWFIDRLKNYHGDDWQKVLNDLKNGEITDDVLFYGFSRLSDRQPLTKAEQTQLSLEHPNIGRPAMMFKTFSLRRIYSVLNDAKRDFKAGRKTRALSMVAATVALMYSLDLAGNVVQDIYRSWIAGREPKELSQTALNTALKNLFVSRYQIGQMKWQTPSQVFGQTFIPSTPVDDIVQAIQRGKAGPLLRNIPVAGQELSLIGLQNNTNGRPVRPTRPTRPVRPVRPVRPK